MRSLVFKSPFLVVAIVVTRWDIYAKAIYIQKIQFVCSAGRELENWRPSLSISFFTNRQIQGQLRCRRMRMVHLCAVRSDPRPPLRAVIFLFFIVAVVVVISAELFFPKIQRSSVPAHPPRLSPRLIPRAPIQRSPFRLSRTARRANPGPIGPNRAVSPRPACLFTFFRIQTALACPPFFPATFPFFFSPASKSQWRCCCRFRCRFARLFGRWKLAAPGAVQRSAAVRWGEEGRMCC